MYKFAVIDNFGFALIVKADDVQGAKRAAFEVLRNTFGKDDQRVRLIDARAFQVAPLRFQ